MIGWWEQIFSPAEMDVVLCGERSIEWDKASLQQHIKLVSNEQGLPCAHALLLRIIAPINLRFISPNFGKNLEKK